MASVLFAEALPHLSLIEMRDILATAAGRLNDRRLRCGEMCFATVRVGDVLVHPLTKEAIFVIQFSDIDRQAFRLVGGVEKKFARISEARGEYAKKLMTFRARRGA